jgi:hypothetical protein
MRPTTIPPPSTPAPIVSTPTPANSPIVSPATATAGSSPTSAPPPRSSAGSPPISGSSTGSSATSTCSHQRARRIEHAMIAWFQDADDLAPPRLSDVRARLDALDHADRARDDRRHHLPPADVVWLVVVLVGLALASLLWRPL